MRRALPVLLFAFLLVTAGCNSFHSSEPNPSPETTTALSGRLAPGLSASGFTDRTKLTEAHDRILEENSYTVRYRVTETASNGSILGFARMTYRSGANATHFRYHTVKTARFLPGNSSKYETSAWSNGTATVIAQTVDGRTRYQRVPDPDALGIRRTTNRDRLYVLTSVLNVTHIERTDDSGTPTYRVVADELVHPSLLTNFDSVRNASLVANIDTWGVVHHYRFETTGTKDGETIHRTETFDISNIGTTNVRRPPWYATAMNITSRYGRSAA